jgi:LysM repeat protein
MNPRKTISSAGWVSIVLLAMVSLLIFSEGGISASFLGDNGSPTLPSIIQPADSATISGKIDVIIEAGTDETKNVVLLVDGRLRGITNIYPYQFSLDTTKWSPGKHILQVKLYLTDAQELLSLPVAVKIASSIETNPAIEEKPSSPQLSQVPPPNDAVLSPAPKLADFETSLQTGAQIVSVSVSPRLASATEMKTSAPSASPAEAKLTTTRKWLMTLTAGPGHKSTGTDAAQETSLNPEMSQASVANNLPSAKALSITPELSARTAPPALTIPADIAPEIAAQSALKAAAEEPLPTRIHVVLKGESLWGISRRYGMTPSGLAKLNHLNEKALLQIGQALTLPENAFATKAAATLILNGKILVPLRQAVESGGGKIYWDAATKQVTILREGKLIVLTPNSDQATLNGNQIDCGKVVLSSGRTYVSSDFLEEAALIPLQDKLKIGSSSVGRLSR